MAANRRAWPGERAPRGCYPNELCPGSNEEIKLAKRLGLHRMMANSVRRTMTTEEPTFSVTLIKASEAGIPLVERGEYMYAASWLPQVGDTIPISRRDIGDGAASPKILGYVTRVDPASEHPISVVEAHNAAASTDDLLA